MKLGNIDYTSEIHPKMIRTVFLKLELNITEDGFEIPEYVVQDYILKSLLTRLRNTKYSAKIETQGKFDCVLYKKPTEEACIYYELKTYLKKNESINISAITKDIEKIRDKITGTDAKGYFILVIAKNKLQKLNENLMFIQNHFSNNRTWYEISDIKLRPSQKEKNGHSIIFSWEIKT